MLSGKNKGVLTACRHWLVPAYCKTPLFTIISVYDLIPLLWLLGSFVELLIINIVLGFRLFQPAQPLLQPVNFFSHISQQEI